MKRQILSVAAIAIAALTCAGEAVARSRNVIPLGWVPKSLLRCEITSDHMCAMIQPKGDSPLVPLVSLPNGKTTVGFIQAELEQVKQLDERDGWIFIGYMGNDGADCRAQSDDENVVHLRCTGRIASYNNLFVCSGKVGPYRAGQGTDRSIGAGDRMCYFAATSDIGKDILSRCPVGTACRVIGSVVDDVDDNGEGDGSKIITRPVFVERVRQ